MRGIASLGLAVVAIGVVLGGCGPSARGDDDVPCQADERRCDGLVLETCVDGSFTPSETCATGCDPGQGCTLCTPNTGTCNGNISHYCTEDGSGFADEICDPLLGTSCSPASGVCEGTCSRLLLGDSYIGCEYYATVTGNAVGNMFNFSVAISNTSGSNATVTIDGRGLPTPITLMVPPGSVATQALPWVHELKMCTGPTSNDCLTPVVYGANLDDGAYHLRSTAPVTVYQFSPLEYTSGSFAFSYSNDASLLLPTNAWSGNYLAVTWAKMDANAPDTWPGMMSITAAQDGTQVTIATTATTNAAPNVPSFSSGVPQTIMLDSGDVFQIAAFGTYGTGLTDNLSGSVVTADKPVQLITAHYCTYIPDRFTGACDHLEESMFPIEALSTRYFVTAPGVPNIPTGKRSLVRIVATVGNTNLTYEPPQPGAPTTIAQAHGYVDIPLAAADYLITADHKVLVAQFMEGQDPISNTGDPAMALAVPVDQYRTTYLFHAPTNYEANFVNVTAPTGATVTLDGVAVTGFTTIGGSGYGITRVLLGAGAGGNHTIMSDLPFGISVVGYGQYTSYWYPGGLDLTDIPVE